MQHLFDLGQEVFRDGLEELSAGVFERPLVVEHHSLGSDEPELDDQRQQVLHLEVLQRLGQRVSTAYDLQLGHPVRKRIFFAAADVAEKRGGDAELLKEPRNVSDLDELVFQLDADHRRRDGVGHLDFIAELVQVQSSVGVETELELRARVDVDDRFADQEPGGGQKLENAWLNIK